MNKGTRAWLVVLALHAPALYAAEYGQQYIHERQSLSLTALFQEGLLGFGEVLLAYAIPFIILLSLLRLIKCGPWIASPLLAAEVLVLFWMTLPGCVYNDPIMRTECYGSTWGLYSLLPVFLFLAVYVPVKRKKRLGSARRCSSPCGRMHKPSDTSPREER